MSLLPAAAIVRKPRRYALPAVLALLSLLVTLVVELFNHKSFTGGLDSFWQFATGAPLALLVNYLLVLLTLVPAIFLRRRVFYITLACAVWLAVGAVNGFILLNRMTPFTVADLTVVNTGLDTLPNYLSAGYIVLLAIAVGALLAGLVLLLWKGPRSNIPGQQRFFAGILVLLVNAGLLFGAWTLAFRAGQLSTVFSNLANAYDDYGFAYCFAQTWLNKGISLPPGYNLGTVRDVRQQIEAGQTSCVPTADDVNVIYVQLESFADPAEIRGLELSEDPVPNWTALNEAYSSGGLRVPVVGAGTANSECEVLTGMSVRFFGPGEYPYQTRLKTRAVETVAYNLKAHGYATHAIHNHRATFYNRNLVYRNLGFDDFTSLEYMPQVEQTPGNWAKDAVLTGQILQALDTTPDQPDLVFTVSVQGHGKYPTEPVLENPAVTVTACPEHLNVNAVEYYVNQLREMDQFIGELVQALNQRKEKTILVLYGDHLPALGLEGADMQSGTLFRTGYVIWDNFGLDLLNEDLAAYQLSAAVLGRLGISDGYFNGLHQVFRGEASYGQELRLLQYDVLYGQQYLYHGKDPYTATDMTMGMVPIVAQTLERHGDAWYISGEHFTPYCRVTVNGKTLDAVYLSPRMMKITQDPGTTDVRQVKIEVVDSHDEILSDTE